MSNCHHIVTTFLIAAGLNLVNDHVNGQQQPGTLKDRDGNTYTIKAFPDDKIWMTENLKINIPGSYCYESNADNCNHYGRLYTWKSAAEGCKALGEGWRLPTNEEWRQMARPFGGALEDSKDSGRAAFNALIYGGNAGFNAVFGGTRDANGDYRRLGAHGFYWTATETDTATASFYNLGKNGRMLNRIGDGEKQRAISVRCVKDVKR